jgi:hypothetical protein
MKKIIFKTFALMAVILLSTSCNSVTKLPAEDIEIFNVCKEEIAILKNPRISARSKEKYDAAISLSRKVDFSYVRTVEFLGKVFSEKDAKINKIDNNVYTVVVYYQYKNKYISYEFKRFDNQIISCVIKLN